MSIAIAACQQPCMPELARNVCQNNRQVFCIDQHKTIIYCYARPWYSKSLKLVLKVVRKHNGQGSCTHGMAKTTWEQHTVSCQESPLHCDLDWYPWANIFTHKTHPIDLFCTATCCITQVLCRRACSLPSVGIDPIVTMPCPITYIDD